MTTEELTPTEELARDIARLRYTLNKYEANRLREQLTSLRGDIDSQIKRLEFPLHGRQRSRVSAQEILNPFATFQIIEQANKMAFLQENQDGMVDRLRAMLNSPTEKTSEKFLALADIQTAPDPDREGWELVTANFPDRSGNVRRREIGTWNTAPGQWSSRDKWYEYRLINEDGDLIDRGRDKQYVYSKRDAGNAVWRAAYSALVWSVNDGPDQAELLIERLAAQEV